jgi:methionine-rich copper-binding protein CopC
MRRLLTMVAVLVCAGLTVSTVPAQAHSALSSASPGPGDTVVPGVPAISLTFDSLAIGGQTRVTVTRQGAPVPTGDVVRVSGTTVCVAVAPLDSGIHAVEYQAPVGDGHPISGRYLFGVAPDGSALGVPPACVTAQLANPTAAGEHATGVSSALVVVGAVGAVVLVAAAWQVARHRRRGGLPPAN